VGPRALQGVDMKAGTVEGFWSPAKVATCARCLASMYPPPTDKPKEP